MPRPLNKGTFGKKILAIFHGLCHKSDPKVPTPYKSVSRLKYLKKSELRDIDIEVLRRYGWVCMLFNSSKRRKERRASLLM